MYLGSEYRQMRAADAKTSAGVCLSVENGDEALNPKLRYSGSAWALASIQSPLFGNPSA